MTQIGKLLLVAGAAIFAAGLLLLLGERLGLGRLGLGRLPGDLRFERGSVRIFFPVTSALLVSVVATLALNLVKVLFRR